MKVTPRRDEPPVAPPGLVPRPRTAEHGSDPSAPKLRHRAAFHHSHRNLLDQLVPMARQAVDAGRTVALAVAPGTERAVRSALADLGAGAAPVVGLAAPREPEAGSGQSVALRRARELRELVALTGEVTVLTEHLPDLDGPDGRFWTELEAAEHVALADLPVRLTCFYPEMPLHLSVLECARRTHPHFFLDGLVSANPAHRPPREVLAGHPPGAPVLLGPPHHRLRIRGWQLREVRRSVRRAATDAGFVPDRVDDVVLAVNEVAGNAVEHGGGKAELHLWSDADGVTCEVHDHGVLPDPLPGLVAPLASEPRGRGLWIARQLCDLLHVWTDDTGTHVRLHCRR